jgi:hypothetical protein
MSYSITWETRGVYKKFSKIVAGAEFLRSSMIIQGDRRFDDIRYTINDFLGIDGHNITDHDILLFVGFARGAYATNPDVKIAVVTTDESIIELVKQSVEPPLSEPYPIEIFPSLEHARRWAQD